MAELEGSLQTSANIRGRNQKEKNLVKNPLLVRVLAHA